MAGRLQRNGGALPAAPERQARGGRPNGRVRRRSLVGSTAKLAALGAGGLLPALVGCGIGPGSAPAAARGGGELHLLYWWDTTWQDTLGPLYQQYTAKTGTKVTLEQTDLGTFPAKVTAGFAADAAWDVYSSYSQNDSKYYDAGYILDLAGYWKRDKFNLADYAVMGTERWCTKAFGMPIWAEPFGIYYNKTMLQQNGLPDLWDAPMKGDWTWDNLVEVAHRVSRPARGDEPSGIWGIWWPYDNVTYFGPNIWTYGGDHVDFEHMRWQLDSPVSIEAYQRFSTWIRTDRIAYANGTAEAKALAAAYTGRDPFSAGKALLRFRSVTDLKTYQRQVGSDFEWDVIGVPKQGNQAGVSMTAGHPRIIWARTKYPDQAFELTRFLALPDAQDQIGRSHITVPALKPKMSTFFDPPPAPHAGIFMDVYKKPRGIHFRHHNTPENWDQYGQAVTPLLAGDRPLVAGLQELNQQMNAKVEYGSCSPYKGLKHPLPPGI